MGTAAFVQGYGKKGTQPKEMKVYVTPFGPFLRKAYTAYDLPLWAGMRDPLDIHEVTQALREKRLYDPAFGECLHDHIWSPRRHAERVAWFVHYGWNKPICLNHRNAWCVIDGNHRLAAAYYRGDSILRVVFRA